MKITKTNKEYSNEIKRRKDANKGCKVCPCCGEKKTLDYYIEKGKGIKGISGGLYSNIIKGFFNPKILRVDCYRCYTCGAEWESEPYEW